MKIANKITLTFSVVALILTMIAVSIVYTVTKNILLESISNGLTTTLVSRTHHIETYLKALKVSIGQLSKSVVLENLLKINDPENAGARETFEIAMKRLERTKEANPMIAEFMLLDATGKVVASSEKNSVGINKSADSLFLGGLKQTHIKDVYDSDVFKEPLMAVSTPFLDSNTGTLLGVVAARVKLNELNAITTERAGLGDTGEIYLVNQYGYMITPSKFVANTVLKQKVDTQNLGMRALQKSSGLPTPEQKMTAFYLDYRGAKVIGRHAFIPEMRWSVLAEIDSEEAFQPLEKLRLFLLVILLVMPFIVLLLSVWISRSITGPLHRLHRGVEIIGGGNLNYKVGIDTKDEVGQLSRAFDTMTESLQKSIITVDELNKQIGVRKQAEDALRESEKRFLDVLYASQDAILIIDGEKFVDCNEATARMLGYVNRSDFLMKHPSELSPSIQPDGKSSLEKAGEMMAIAHEKGFHRFEWIHRRANGEDFPVQVSLTPIVIRGRTVLHCVWLDLTEQKENERRLSETRTKLEQQTKELAAALAEALKNRKILASMLEDNNLIRQKTERISREWAATFDSIKDLISIQDKDCKLIRVNRAYADTFKLKPDELIGKHCYEFVHGANTPVPHCPHLEAVETGQPVTRELFEPHLGIFLEVNVSPIFNDKGECVGSVHIARDISERKRASEMLRQNEEKFRTIFEHSAVAITFADQDERIISWNKFTENLLAMTHDDLYLRPLHSLYSKEEWERIRAMKIRERGVIDHLETMMIRKDGSLINVDIAISIMKDPTGKVTGSIGIFRDITERKQAEVAMRLAKEVAESAARFKSQFLANMSHEIRTPMNAVLGFAGLLKETNLDQKQQNYLESITSGGNILLEIINDILDISKVEAGHVTLEQIDFDLEHLIGDVLKMLRPRLSGKPIHCYYEIPPDLCRGYEGDPTRLRQILLNLLGNAVKFTEQGEICLAVRVEKVMEGNERLLRFSVKDSGIGIPADKQHAVFDAFIQTDMSTTRKYGGTGLGLAICKNLVKLMGGDIWVESEPGRGSTFIFTALLKEKPGFIDNQINPIPKSDLKGKKVLIVDDNEKFRQLAKIIFESLGVSCEEAKDAQDALNRLSIIQTEEELPDFALVDIMMPETDGYELARRIRKESRYDKTKLIASSSDITVGISAKAQACGFNGFLPKPIIKDELISTICIVLGDERTGGQIITRHMANEFACKGIKVLVVEDTVANQMLMKSMLGNWGCVVDVAVNGREAVDKAKANSYDIILMDMQMPVMNGVEATELIRKEISQILPIVALTAAAMKEDEVRALRAGMNDFVAKPLNAVMLKEKILKYVVR